MPLYSSPNKKRLYVRMGIEVGAFAVFAISALAFTSLDNVHHQRGFYCTDQGIDKPFVKDEQVPVMHCFMIWASIAAITIVSVEVVQNLVYRPLNYEDLNIQPLYLELYRVIGSFVLGGTFTMVVTEIAKVNIGEYRPHFLQLCGLIDKDGEKSNLCKDTQWNVGLNFSTQCPNSKNNPYGLTHEDWSKKLEDARKSFLSGHSSFSFYSAIFLALYLKARLSNLRSKEKYMGSKIGIVWAEWILLVFKTIRPFLQVSYVALAFFIALGRVSDYYHHPRDVITGGLLGTLGAFLTYTEIAHLHTRPRVFHTRNFENNHTTYLEMDAVDGSKKEVEPLKENPLENTDEKKVVRQATIP